MFTGVCEICERKKAIKPYEKVHKVLVFWSKCKYSVKWEKQHITSREKSDLLPLPSKPWH